MDCADARDGKGELKPLGRVLAMKTRDSARCMSPAIRPGNRANKTPK